MFVGCGAIQEQVCACMVKVKVDIGNLPKLLFGLFMQSSFLNWTQSVFANLLQGYSLSIFFTLEFQLPHPPRIYMSSADPNSGPHI